MNPEEAYKIVSECMARGKIVEAAQDREFWETVKHALAKRIPVEPKLDKVEDEYGIFHFICGECGKDLFGYGAYCSSCGKKALPQRPILKNPGNTIEIMKFDPNKMVRIDANGDISQEE